MSGSLLFKMSNNRFEDEFTVHVVSSASREIFYSNTLASFRNFFNDEIQLAGDWRVALSEIIFTTKTENIVNGNLIAYNLKDFEDSQKISSGANVISRPLVDSNFVLCQEPLIQWLNFLLQLSAQLGCPIFHSESRRALGDMKFYLASMRELRFPAKKF